MCGVRLLPQLGTRRGQFGGQFKCTHSCHRACIVCLEPKASPVHRPCSKFSGGTKVKPTRSPMLFYNTFPQHLFCSKFSDGTKVKYSWDLAKEEVKVVGELLTLQSNLIESIDRCGDCNQSIDRLVVDRFGSAPGTWPRRSRVKWRVRTVDTPCLP